MKPTTSTAVTLVTAACAIIAVSLLPSCSTAGTSGTSQPSANTAGGSAKVTPYPLTTCIVTDNDLGSMGDERRIVHQGREIKFCCEPCVAKFNANPAKFLAKLP